MRNSVILHCSKRGKHKIMFSSNFIIKNLKFILNQKRNSYIFFSFLLFFSVYSFSFSQLQVNDIDYGTRVFYNSEKLFEEKLLREAELNLIKSIDKFPYNPTYGKAELLRAKIDIISGNYEVSKNTLLNFVDRFPNSPLQSNALMQIALIYIEQEKWDQAQGYFELTLKRIEFDRSRRNDYEYFTDLQSQALYWQGIAIYQQGRYYESIPSFKQIITETPKSDLVSDAYFAIALVYERNQDYDSAIVNFNHIINEYQYSSAVLSSAIRSANNHILLLKASRALFDLETAANIYNHIQMQDSIGKLYAPQKYTNYSIDEISYMKGEAYNIIGNYPQAISEMNAFMETYSDTKLRTYFLYGIGWSNLKNSNYTEAINYFEKVIAEASDNEKQLKDFAEFYHSVAIAKSGKIDEAQKEFLNLASRSDFPFAGVALLEIAQINYNAENYNEARKNLVRAEKEITSGRILARVHLLLGATYMQLKKYDAAIFEFEKANTIIQNSNIVFFPEKDMFRSEIMFRKSVCFIQLNRYKEAINNLNNFIATKPSDNKLSEAMFWLAESYYRSDLLTNAQNTYESLLSQYPNYRREEVLYGLGWSYFRVKNFKKSTEYFNILTKEFPKSNFATEVLARQADGYYIDKNYIKAAEYYQRASQLSPKTEEGQYAAYQLCNAYYHSSQYPKAINALLEFVGKYPNSAFAPHSVYLMGWIKFIQKEYQDAINNYSYLIEAYTQSNLVPRSYYSIGDCYFNQGNYEKALDYYRKVIELFPSDGLAPEALKSTQYCYIALGRNDEAIALADQYIKSNPNSPAIVEFAFKKAEMFFSGQRYGDAAQEYQQFLEKHPDSEYNAEAMYWMAMSYLNLNETEQAMSTYKKVATKYPKSDFAPKSLLELAQILRNNTYLMEADSVYNSIYENFKTTDFAAQALYKRADIALSFGDTAKTLNLYNEVANQYPTNPYGLSARYRIGMYLRNTNMNDSALKQFELLSSLSEDPELAAESQFRAGEMYMRLLNYEKAIIAFNVVKDKYSTVEVWFPLSLLSLGEAYEKKEDYASAINTYKSLIAINPDDDYSKTARSRLKFLTNKLDNK